MKFKALLLGLIAATIASAQVIPTPIGSLPQLSTLVGTEIFPLQQSNGISASIDSSDLAYYTLSQLSSSQIINLWTGSCSSSTFLNGAGVCASAGSGSGVGNVSTSGSPIAGNLTTFSGSTTISNGNLSGDCTTSGTLFVTCTGTNGVAFGSLATANATTPPALGSTTPAAGKFTTLQATSTLTTNVTGSTQCLQVNSSGVVSGTGSGCASGGSAAAGSLTGTTLAANVVNSSLTSVGAITSGSFPAANLTGSALNGGILSSSLTSVGTLTSLNVSGAITTGGVTVGYLNIPQNAQSANYTAVLSDSGKQITSTTSSAVTFTIPANASVAYPIGTVITFTTIAGTGTVTIGIGGTDTLTLAGTSLTGNRSLAPSSIATAIKVTATTWNISGAGLT